MARPSRRIVLTTFGSFGDLHPYMAIALELQKRGHAPVIATSEYYRPKVQAAGLEFRPVRPDLPREAEFEAVIAKVMATTTGPEYLFKQLLMPALQGSYRDLDAACADADLLITHMITFAGPLVAQKRALPWISTVLAPISFFSPHDPPVPPIAPLFAVWRYFPPGFNRLLIAFGKRAVLHWVQPVVELRAELGLPPAGHPLFDGQHAPGRVLALFSPLLGAPQPDWPPQTRTTGFAFYDMHDPARADAGLQAFLDTGEPPIVFTLGSSAVFDAGEFFRAGAAAALRLNRRAVLLVGHGKNRPVGLPAAICACDYAPYSELFPRAAAIVHQGGVGTTGQAMRAGKPMLVMPYSHDQPDHAARMQRLGIGRTLSRRRFSVDTATRELATLLNNPSYAEKASAIGQAVHSEAGVRAACDEIEAFMNAVKK